MAEQGKTEKLLHDWLAFSKDVVPSCAAGYEQLQELRQRTEAMLGTEALDMQKELDRANELVAHANDVISHQSLSIWKQHKDIERLRRENRSLVQGLPCLCLWSGSVGPEGAKMERHSTCPRCQKLGAQGEQEAGKRGPGSYLQGAGSPGQAVGRPDGREDHAEGSQGAIRDGERAAGEGEEAAGAAETAEATAEVAAADAEEEEKNRQVGVRENIKDVVSDLLAQHSDEQVGAILRRALSKDLYTIEPHGDGYALYLGRDQWRHGLNLARITEATPEMLRLIERALNAGSTS